MYLHGFLAAITVEDVVAQQFAAETSADGRTCTCWIASEAGKGFSIQWTDILLRHPSSGRVEVDGIECGGKVIEPGVNHTARRSTVTTSTNAKRQLKFGTLELTDDDAFMDATTSERIGEIVLKIRKVQIRGHAVSKHAYAFPETGKVHERSKKASNHRVNLGKEIKCTERKVTRVRHSEQVLATFIFKYRPLDVLQAREIAPRAVPLRLNSAASSRTMRSTDREDVIQISDSSDDERPTRTAKKKKVGKPPKLEPHDVDVKPFISGEVIDLT